MMTRQTEFWLTPLWRVMHPFFNLVSNFAKLMATPIWWQNLNLETVFVPMKLSLMFGLLSPTFWRRPPMDDPEKTQNSAWFCTGFCMLEIKFLSATRSWICSVVSHSVFCSVLSAGQFWSNNTFRFDLIKQKSGIASTTLESIGIATENTVPFDKNSVISSVWSHTCWNISLHAHAASLCWVKLLPSSSIFVGDVKLGMCQLSSIAPSLNVSGGCFQIIETPLWRRWLNRPLCHKMICHGLPSHFPIHSSFIWSCHNTPAQTSSYSDPCYRYSRNLLQYFALLRSTKIIFLSSEIQIKFPAPPSWYRRLVVQYQVRF